MSSEQVDAARRVLFSYFYLNKVTVTVSARSLSDIQVVVIVVVTAGDWIELQF
jgi:hypothetical protein